MITEDYCSFELSKLLKEKGFDGYCRQYDFEDWEKRHSTITSIRPYNFNEDDKCISIPTHQMAMKWLREEHKIFVEVSVCIDTNGDYHYHSMALDKICEYILPSIGTYDTYEEAVEAALKYVLEKFD